MLLTAMLLVFEARDGFRSIAMLVFPGMLLISVMLLDRASLCDHYRHGPCGSGGAGDRRKARPHPRHTARAQFHNIRFDILRKDLNLLVFAMIGSRIARDTRKATSPTSVASLTNCRPPT